MYIYMKYIYIDIHMYIMSFTTHKDPINNLILQRENTNLESDLHKVTKQLSVPL